MADEDEKAAELDALHRLDESAVELQRRVCALRRPRADGPALLPAATPHSALTRHLRGQGEYMKALEVMERGLVLRQHFFGADSEEVWRAAKTVGEMCNLLAMTYLQQGERAQGGVYARYPALTGAAGPQRTSKSCLSC